MAAILNFEHRMKSYYLIGSRNRISIEYNYKKSHYTGLCAIEGHFMNFVFSVAAILDYLKSSADFIFFLFIYFYFHFILFFFTLGALK